MNKKTITQISPDFFKGKKVLVRVDFNVPQNEDLSISNDSRIKAALPTIDYLRNAGARVILMSHLGRPKGCTPKYSLSSVAVRLSKLINSPVSFIEDCVGASVKQQVDLLKNGDVCLLENVRFHPEEEANDSDFAQQLAQLGDIYVNDAFGSAHRAHASTEGVTHHIRPAMAGILNERELVALSGALNNPARPFATVIGGAKVSSKIGVLDNLISKVDILVIGGAMAFSFLKAQGKQVGMSLVEDDRLEFCRQLESKAKSKGVRIILPEDVVCALELKADAISTICSVDSIPANQMGLDIGPKTIDSINNILKEAKTIMWNGPMGVFEIPAFSKGTHGLVDTLIRCTKNGAKTIVGGGDSVAAIEAYGISNDLFSHVSTGGGATLEFLEGLELPGIASLDDAELTKANANV